MTPRMLQYSASSQDQLNFITRAHADQQLHLVVRFVGPIDKERMATAIRRTMDRDPVLGCRFIEQPNRTFWQCRSDLDELELCSVTETGNVDADLMAFVVAPSDPCVDPLVQARIFRSTSPDTPNGDTLCLKVNHVVADGAGTKELGYLVADTYARLEADPSYRPNVERFRRRNHLGIFRAVGLKNLIRHRPRKMVMPAPQIDLPFTGRETIGRAFAIHQIERQEFQQLKVYGKARGSTINDLILAALFRSLCAHGKAPEAKPLHVQVSIDLRHFWKELGLDSILTRGAGAKRSTLRLLDAILVMMANRTVEPVSKLYCWEQWWREEVLAGHLRRLRSSQSRQSSYSERTVAPSYQRTWSGPQPPILLL